MPFRACKAARRSDKKWHGSAAEASEHLNKSHNTSHYCQTLFWHLREMNGARRESDSYRECCLMKLICIRRYLVRRGDLSGDSFTVYKQRRPQLCEDGGFYTRWALSVN